ncbi:MAG: DUF167 domain-containing protein [Methanolinea sp.]|nr:DUF167 domain-containing protein [Methanolinea sp.]
MRDYLEALTGTGEGTLIALEVSAGASRDRFPGGYNPWRKSIGCQVTEPPVGGKANQAVITLVSAVLGIPKARIVIHSGAGSPAKRLLIRRMPVSELADILEGAWPEE